MKGLFCAFSIRTKLLSLAVLFGIGFIGLGVSSFRTMTTVKVNGPIYRNIVQGKDLIADILPPPEYIIESYLIVLQMVDEKDGKVLNTLAERCKQLHADYEQRHEFWKTDLDEGEIKRILLQDSYRPACAFFDILDRDFIPACTAGRSATSEGTGVGGVEERI